MARAVQTSAPDQGTGEGGPRTHWVAFTLIFGTPEAYPLFGGFIAGYLTYDYMHYWVHHFVPKSKLGKRLREQHMRHHFQDHRFGYGVSSPLWDVVFRTLPRRRSH